MSLATDLQGDLGETLDDPDIGRDITINRYAPGAYNSSDGSVAPATVQTWSTRGVLLNYADTLVSGNQNLQGIGATGSDIKRGDRALYLKLKDLPTYQAAEADKITVGGDIYTVMSFKTIELSGTAIIYILQVRR
jgi:hypothetical protein